MMDDATNIDIGMPREGLIADKQRGVSETEEKDHYENFMRRHLEHYGYYTGRNANFRDNFRSLQQWKKNYDLRLGGNRDLGMDEQLGGNNQFIEGPLFSGDGQLPDEFLNRTTQLVFQYQSGRKIPKLREPRNLYALTKEAGPQQATRWPSHMQVVCPAIQFIDYIPPVPDPLFKPTGKEPTPSVKGPQQGEMIYYNDPGRDIYFMRSRVAGCRLAMQSVALTPREYPDDNLTLEFESRFESGNLLKVDKLSDFEYELTLRPDLYTNKHTQWFFFRVRNMRPGRNYRFTIINLMKPSSLYNQGMKPVFYSETNAKKHKIGWVRWGSNIRYFRNNLGTNGRNFYSLTWTCDFPFSDDCCYFAHCFPYTYTDLQEYLLNLANDPVRSRFCKQRVLCRTLAGNLVYILTITSPSRNPEISRAKRAVVLTGRVHPGETNASWMMKGFLDYLCGSSADAKLLRDTFIFKIVPMLNPDGVIVGNYRCSLTGRDLNRNYKSVLKDSFPSIWHTKVMIKRLNAEREIVVYCDLHGHSRKNNIFIYGCENKHNRERRLRERVFPMMLSQNARDSFSFDSCKYKVQKSKEGTGRIVVWCMGVMNSYTMEATFGGATLPGPRKDTHLSTRDLEKIGHDFCDTILDYCDPDPSKVEACMRELYDRMRRHIMRKMNRTGDLDDIDIFAYMSESDTSGSDSSCDDGLPVHLLAIAPKLQRKKKMKSRRERSKQASNHSKAVIPSGADNSKQLSSNSKHKDDSAKSLRYSQGSHGTTMKRRDNFANASGDTSSGQYADDRGGQGRMPKKPLYTLAAQMMKQVRAQRATFVWYAKKERPLRCQQVQRVASNSRGVKSASFHQREERNVNLAQAEDLNELRCAVRARRRRKTKASGFCSSVMPVPPTLPLSVAQNALASLYEDPVQQQGAPDEASSSSEEKEATDEADPSSSACQRRPQRLHSFAHDSSSRERATGENACGSRGGKQQGSTGVVSQYDLQVGCQGRFKVQKQHRAQQQDSRSKQRRQIGQKCFNKMPCRDVLFAATDDSASNSPRSEAENLTKSEPFSPEPALSEWSTGDKRANDRCAVSRCDENALSRRQFSVEDSGSRDLNSIRSRDNSNSVESSASSAEIASRISNQQTNRCRPATADAATVRSNFNMSSRIALLKSLTRVLSPANQPPPLRSPDKAPRFRAVHPSVQPESLTVRFEKYGKKSVARRDAPKPLFPTKSKRRPSLFDKLSMQWGPLQCQEKYGEGRRRR